MGVIFKLFVLYLPGRRIQPAVAPIGSLFRSHYFNRAHRCLDITDPVLYKEGIDKADKRGVMGDLTKTKLLEKLLKLLQTDRDMNFLLSLEEKDLTTLLIALRERIENRK